MKRLCLLLLFCSFGALAQTQTLNQIELVEKTKSGNFKDVLAGFHQLAFKTLSQDEKNIEFNTTLFGALKNSEYGSLRNMSRSKIIFLRNTQIGAKVNFDNDFNLKGYALEGKFALMNKRDVDFVNIRGTNANRLNELLQSKINTLDEMNYLPLFQSEAEFENGINEIYAAIHSGVNLGTPAYNQVIKDLDALIFADPSAVDLNGAKLATVQALITQRDADLANFYSATAVKPLWTISAKGATDTRNKFERVDFESVFLRGDEKNWIELDLRAKFTYADTGNVNLPRTAFNGKAGVNIKLKNAKAESIFETKFYGEFNAVLKNVLPDEEKNSVLANAEIRIRLLEDLWVPLTLKYDVEHANLLGFLNLTFNFGDGS
ncbi:hypothetical protein [Flavobacterium sp.]|uniref:hypothetical protein n=1 Tax=Flavobacterium sp. TaxID=239 RepID=UPI0011FAB45B|nr:hypothetical protein [Flavobacterium sp.]RZJ70511.1 MAG: hypothetical protein EOO49_13710 [Flavobacterium sp.]